MIRRRSFLALAAACLFSGSLLAADMEVMGKFVKVDTKSIVIENDKGKSVTYVLPTTAKLYDPKGVALKDGFKDKALVANHEVKLVMDEKTKAVKEVHLVMAAKTTPKDGGTKALPRDDIKGGIPAKVTKVDVEKRIAWFTLDNGKKSEHKLAEDVKFIGPKGGHRKDGIKDDCFVETAEVILVLDKENHVTEIHLPYKNTIEKLQKDKKDK